MAKHILEVAPKAAKVIFENDVVRAIEITMRKGQKFPMHSHNRGISYSLNASKIRSTNETGKSGLIKVKKGAIGWSEYDGMETHAVDILADCFANCA